MKKVFSLILSVLFSTISFAQQWTNYFAGPANNDMTSVNIDAQGNKWVITRYRALSKFDGTNWTNYPIPNNLSIRCFIIDAQNNKWVGTNNGVLKFDGSVWTHYTTANGLIMRIKS